MAIHDDKYVAAIATVLEETLKIVNSIKGLQKVLQNSFVGSESRTDNLAGLTSLQPVVGQARVGLGHDLQTTAHASTQDTVAPQDAPAQQLKTAPVFSQAKAKEIVESMRLSETKEFSFSK